MNEETIDSLFDIITFLENPSDFSKVMSLLSSGMNVLNGISACGAAESFKDIKEFCTEDPEKCSLQSFMDNVTSNLFVLMGKFSDVVDVLAVFPGETYEEIYS